VTWSTSDENVATVDQNGIVKAVAPGTATITATSDADSSKKDSCVVIVEPEVVSKVTLETEGALDEILQGQEFAGGTVILSSNYDVDGVMTYVRLKDSEGNDVNFDTIFDEFNLSTKVGECEIEGPYNMTGAHSVFIYGPDGGFAIEAGVKQETYITGKVNENGAIGEFVLITEVRKGEKVLADSEHEFKVTKVTM
jgi:hypothetical protein